MKNDLSLTDKDIFVSFIISTIVVLVVCLAFWLIWLNGGGKEFFIFAKYVFLGWAALAAILVVSVIFVLLIEFIEGKRDGMNVS